MRAMNARLRLASPLINFGTRRVRLALVLGFVFLTTSATAQRAFRSEAEACGFHGPVRTVSTERLDNLGKVVGSSRTEFDVEGRVAEQYEYDANGALVQSTKFTRKGPQIIRTEIINNMNPEISSTSVAVLDSDGEPAGYENCDGHGVLIGRNYGPRNKRGTTITEEQVTNADGTIANRKFDATVDPENQTSMVTKTTDGTIEDQWMWQRDQNGRTVADVRRQPDGSYQKRETQADGTVIEEMYFAPGNTKFHRRSRGHVARCWR